MHQPLQTWPDRKTAVVYAFHQYDRNVRFFMRHGLSSHQGVDYFVVQNHPEWNHDHPTEVQAKPLGLSHVHWIHRPNLSQDIGAYGSAMRHMDTTQYNFFVFVNSSMRGPFLPPWSDFTRHWSQYVTDKLTDSVALVGSAINYYYGKPHVQSMMMAMDQRGVSVYQEHDLFMLTDQVTKKHVLIQKYEVGGSQAILAAGYNLDCFVTALQNRDWRKIPQYFIPEDPKHYDMWGHSNYFGNNLHPYEVMFFKTNRHYKDEANITNLLTFWFENAEWNTLDAEAQTKIAHTADEFLKEGDYVEEDPLQITSPDGVVPKSSKLVWVIVSSVLAVALVVVFTLWMISLRR